MAISDGIMGKKRKLAGSHEPSPLYLLLLQDFALGKVSATQVQRIADAAVRSGANSEDLLLLQGLGSNGFAAQNSHRDMMKLPVFRQMRAPHLTHITTPVQVRAADGQLRVQPESISLLLPHLWVNCLEKPLGCEIGPCSLSPKPP